MTQQDQLNYITAWQTATANANQLRAAYNATVTALASEQTNFTSVQAQAAAMVAAEQQKLTAAQNAVTASKSVLDTANSQVSITYQNMVSAFKAPLDPPSTGVEIV